MKTASYYFNYDSKNLDLVKLDLFSGNFDINIVIISAIFLFLCVFIYLMMPKIIWYYLVLQEENLKEANKNRIKELILMKEIQSEIEKDIDSAMLNSWLKSA